MAERINRFRILAALLLAAVLFAIYYRSSREDTSEQPLTEEQLKESAEKLVDIDEIAVIERIVADSSLMNGTGEKAWKRVNDRLVRIKDGNRYFLRMQTEDGVVTSMTYRYDD